MDDMKKLVEKYKRELMEYSKAAKHEMPNTRLEFPEMTEEDMPQENAPPVAMEEPPSQPHAPQMIGYGADEVMDAFSDIFAKLPNTTAATEELTDDDDNGVSTVTPEEAERLDDIPESGESPDEQLAQRDFEEQEETVNSREDIKPLQQQGAPAIIPTEREYASLQEFTDINERRGTARFRTYTARGALPVAGATIIVFRQIGGQRHVFYTLTTDESGQTPIISLPAPPKELSESPDSPITPYATYDAQVNAAGYDEVIIRSMPIFDGVLSVQRIALVPALGQMPEIIDNTEPQLNGGA